MEFLSAGERTPEQLRSVPGRPGHIGGAHRQFGPDAYPAADGRAANAARPKPKPAEQGGRRDRQENPQPDVPTEPVRRRTGVTHIGQSGHALIVPCGTPRICCA